MKYLLLLSVFCLLACTHLPQATDFPSAEVRQYQVTAANGADSLVIGEYQHYGRWRWIETNALGVPLARQIYQGGKWQNDGFLPPNNLVKSLFVAIMLADHFGHFPTVIEKRIGDQRQFFAQQKLWLETSPTPDGRILLHTKAGSWKIKRL